MLRIENAGLVQSDRRFMFLIRIVEKNELLERIPKSVKRFSEKMRVKTND
ncbi:hypothetical protein CEV33_2890 [Brucella grignonensis]|uniref:Uncharacterized protein n=1 Tax=Brucella grignonensis TaxID=94627 RepID=A0A256F305_9HYPH|nr:hypothetical protein CEV33_2890 [Brucella grignonensis]